LKSRDIENKVGKGCEKMVLWELGDNFPMQDAFSKDEVYQSGKIGEINDIPRIRNLGM